VINRLQKYIFKDVHIAPLVVFRIAFGLLMFASTLRFILKGWVAQLYIDPKVYFPFYGFEWVKPLGETGMYILFGLLLVSSLFIMLGLFYRISAIVFFIVFTYVELIDKTNYLNHYYFISLASLLLCFLPAHHWFSLDSRVLKVSIRSTVSNSAILILKFQVAILYFFAGVAKLNPEWLFDAMPLKIWLRAFTHYPIIGPYMEDAWVAYLFSWFGCVYDLCIPFLLFNKKTVRLAYFFVFVFHVCTALFFNIGMFPYVMMTITVIFFSEDFHKRIISFIAGVLRFRFSDANPGATSWKPALIFRNFIIAFFIIQLALPFRYLFYNGNLFWTEQGYRFSWRVMLMEKAGTAFFYVKDKKTNKEIEVTNCEFLTPFQHKMVCTQPDMILDYAHFLKKHYSEQGFEDPAVRVEAYVTLNGRPSTLLIDPNTDLTKYSDGFAEKKFILPLSEK
jgi:hypothetical protein